MFTLASRFSRQGSSEERYSRFILKENKENKENNSPLHQSFLGVLSPRSCSNSLQDFLKKNGFGQRGAGEEEKEAQMHCDSKHPYNNFLSKSLAYWNIIYFSWCKTHKRVPRVLADQILFFTIDLIAPGCFRRAMKVIRTADALRNAYSESKKKESNQTNNFKVTVEILWHYTVTVYLYSFCTTMCNSYTMIHLMLVAFLPIEIC